MPLELIVEKYWHTNMIIETRIHTLMHRAMLIQVVREVFESYWDMCTSHFKQNDL